MGQPTRKGYLSSVSNNPRSNWYEYLGLPEDIDEWTIEDLRGLVVAPTPATPADPAESKLQITLADFQGYLDCVGNPYRYLAANRPVPQGVSANGTNGDASSSSAPQDAASLAGVPEICFRSDFDLAQPETFGEAKEGGEGEVAAKPAKKIMDQLRELSLDGFEEVMAGVVAPLMVLLRRAAAIHTALKQALAPSLAGASNGGAGEEEEEDAAVAYAKQIEQQSADTLHAVCELAHERYARLLKVRKDVHTKLPLTLFVRVNRVAVEFTRDVQHLCGRPCHALSTELQQHANAFLDATHADAAKKLDAIVEVEQWKQVDIPSDYQDIVSSLVRKQVPKIQEAELLKLREAEPAADKANVAKELIVDGAAYKAVSSGLLLLSMVTHYMQCLANLQTVATHVAQKLPALLKLFHTKAYQQVLMAGAMRPDSAGLKSISAKHLALSSQSLGMFLALMPHIKAVLAAYVPEAQRTLLKEMDSATADYEEHQQQLFSKFVSILEERRREHVKKLGAALAPSEERRRPETSACIKAVVEDIVKMHKTLQPLLTRHQLHAVFTQVLASFDTGLLTSYQYLDTTPVFTRQCIVQDVHFVRTEVDKLHLVPNVFPELVKFAQGLTLHQ